jgi:Phosphotransferase enzyme family
MVLNHDDLLEMNIHVDEGTGRITGIVDWADAKIAPFGTSLGGLETILGVQTLSRWLFHLDHNYLRTQFGETFYGVIGYLSDNDRRAIEVGRIFGLFRTYGFDRRPEKDNAAPLEEGDQELVCLEAFCLG